MGGSRAASWPKWRRGLVVKRILLYWRDIPVQEVSRLESEFSDEQLLQMIRNHGSASAE